MPTALPIERVKMSSESLPRVSPTKRIKMIQQLDMYSGCGTGAQTQHLPEQYLVETMVYHSNSIPSSMANSQ